MVINNLDIDRAGRAARPFKTDPPLVVDADAVLTLPIALECFQPVAGQSDEILQARRRLQSISRKTDGHMLVGTAAPCSRTVTDLILVPATTIYLSGPELFAMYRQCR
jgi:hypothetical protein